MLCFVVILALIALQPTNSIYTCTGGSRCTGTITCDNEADCIFTCSGFTSCTSARFECHGLATSCNVDCGPFACYYLDIYSQTNTYVNCNGEKACEHTIIDVTGNGVNNVNANVTCNGRQACFDTDVFVRGTAPNNQFHLFCGDANPDPTCVYVEVKCLWESKECQVECATNDDFSCLDGSTGYNNQIECPNNGIDTTCNIINGNFYYQYKFNPTQHPTVNPTKSPTKKPTRSPTPSPTSFPSKTPSKSPTKNPSIPPTKFPTKNPTKNPTNAPTVSPTDAPSVSPSIAPSNAPSAVPSNAPSDAPTLRPTSFEDMNNIKSNYVMNNNWAITNFQFPAAIGQCMQYQYGSEQFMQYECITNDTAIQTIYSDETCNDNYTISTKYYNTSTHELKCNGEEDTYVELEFYSNDGCPQIDLSKSSIFIADSVCTSFGNNNQHYRLHCAGYKSINDDNYYSIVFFQYYTDKCSIYGHTEDPQIESEPLSNFNCPDKQQNIFNDF
eukprot:10188_1